MSELDQEVREHYTHCCLSNHRVDAILSAGDQCCWGRFAMTWSIGLAAALITITTFLYFAFPQQVGEHGPQRIVTEVARSHAKQLDPEFKTADYVELQAKLARIDFSVIPNNAFIFENYALVGGRYCSIHTCLAVQVKLKDKLTGESVTLYIAKIDDTLDQAVADTRIVDGVRVQVWRDKERFFAMARNAHPPVSYNL